MVIRFHEPQYIRDGMENSACCRFILFLKITSHDHHYVSWPIPCNSQLEIYLLPFFACFIFVLFVWVKGSVVVVRWKPCTASLFTLYHREMLSEGKSHWKAVNVSRYETSYALHLGCQKEHEIAVTAWNSSAETPLTSMLKHGRLWRVRTFGGENTE